MHPSQIIDMLQLLPHPEGGHYRESYRSGENVSHINGTDRDLCTAIFYLLQGDERSLFHRIQSDELWFFHQGTTLEICSIRNDRLHTILLGNNLQGGESLQAVIPANTWFAARVKDQLGYALVSCVVAPGFDFSDFELAEKKELLASFPHLEKAVLAFTK